MTNRQGPSRTRSMSLGAAFGTAGCVVLGAVGFSGPSSVSADVSSGDRPVFVSIDPCRVTDTRPTQGIGGRTTPLGPADTADVSVRPASGNCSSMIPTDALSVQLNVTALNATELTFLTLYPTDTPQPDASALNPAPGQPPTPNAVTTAINADGEFSVYNDVGSVDLLVDIVGYYVAHDHDDRYYTESESDDRHYTKSESDELYYAESESDDRFERSSDTLLIGSQEFHSREVGSQWDWNAGVEHEAATAGDECIQAPITLPHGVEVTGVELVYTADASLAVEVAVVGVLGVPETVLTDQDLLQFVAGGPTTLPSTPVTELGGHDLGLRNGARQIDTSRFNYSAALCTSDELEVFGLRLTLAPAR